MAQPVQVIYKTPRGASVIRTMPVAEAARILPTLRRDALVYNAAHRIIGEVCRDDFIGRRWMWWIDQDAAEVG